jgi:glyoxylase-like metal-dependent hydrolase (beta-lactamase superfamily II)
VIKNGKPVPTFPRAKYYSQKEEWVHAHENQRDGVSYFNDNYDLLVESGQMKLLEGDGEICPGISVRIYPGHTRGMQGILLRSGGQTACYIGDLIPTSAHLDLNWVMGFDLYPLQTIESRKKYYAEAVPEKWLTMFTHDPDVPWGYVEQDEKGKMLLKQI